MAGDGEGGADEYGQYAAEATDVHAHRPVDALPFGYFVPYNDPSYNDPSAPDLLNVNEASFLNDFFAQEDPTASFPQADSSRSHINIDLAGIDKNGHDFVPPAEIHGISTIQEGTQYPLGLFLDYPIESPNPADPSSSSQNQFSGTTPFYTQEQSSHQNVQSPSFHRRSNSFQHSVPTTGNYQSGPMNGFPLHSPGAGLDSQQLSFTNSGHIPFNMQPATQYPLSNANHQGLHMPHVIPNSHRTYSYGTDQAFSRDGYVVPSETGKQVEERLIRNMRPALDQNCKRNIEDNEDDEKSARRFSHRPNKDGDDDDDVQQSVIEALDDQDNYDDRPPKRRRMSKPSTPVTNGRNTINTSNKNDAGTNRSKDRKTTRDGTKTPSKKKRPSLPGQKVQRENLTEEQKRENHTQSERRRRLDINERLKDLRALVPEIADSGHMNRCAEVTAVADFIASLHEGNQLLGQEGDDFER